MTVTHDFDEIARSSTGGCSASRGAPSRRLIRRGGRDPESSTPTGRGRRSYPYHAEFAQGEAHGGDAVDFMQLLGPSHEQVHAECRAEWEDSPETRRRVWDVFKAAPEPTGTTRERFGCTARTTRHSGC